MRGRTRVPFIPQMEAVECGAACLASILGHWGHHAPLSEVRERCGVGRDGVDGASIIAAARGYRLEAEAVALEAEHARDLPLPAILHWEFKHFVVLEGLSSRGAWIMDPAQGRLHVSARDFALCFTGVAFCFAPEAGGFERRARRRQSLGHYRDLLRSLRPALLGALAASLALQATTLAFPLANRFLVDRVLLPRAPGPFKGLAIALLLAVGAQALLTLLRGLVLHRLRVEMDRRLMLHSVRHLARLPIAFFLQRQPGDLMHRVEGNAALRDLFSSRSLSALLDAFVVAGAGTLMLVYAPGLAGLVFLTALARAGVLLLFRRAHMQTTLAEMSAAGLEHAALVEAFSGLETMKARGSERFVLERWTHRLVRRLNRGHERLRLTAASTHALAALQGLALALVLVVGGSAVIEGRMSLGLFTAFLTLQQVFSAPLEGLLGAWTELQCLSSHLARLDDVLAAPPEAEGSRDPGPLRGEIRLEGVSFRYAESAPWVLRDLDLHIRPGEKIALVGPTGAGKTTLARLLVGMHLPTAGTLSYDGQPLSELRLAPLRAQFGVVPQEAVLVDGTVRENVALADPGLPLTRLQEAARVACIDGVIEALPSGWESRLGENGASLSGGERQRLCLARAIATRPAILLLDEATSALDLDTEARVHAGLARLGCTRILIAHRLETVKDADRILVLHEGRIVQSGPFAALSLEAGPLRAAVEAMEASHA